MESAWSRIEPDMYFEASVVMAMGAERSGRCKTGLERKRCFKVSKAV